MLIIRPIWTGMDRELTLEECQKTTTHSKELSQPKSVINLLKGFEGEPGIAHAALTTIYLKCNKMTPSKYERVYMMICRMMIFSSIANFSDSVKMRKSEPFPLF